MNDFTCGKIVRNGPASGLSFAFSSVTVDSFIEAQMVFLLNGNEQKQLIIN